MVAEGFLSLLHYLYDGEDDQIRRKVMRVQQVFHQVVTWISLLVASPLVLLSLYFQQWLSFGADGADYAGVTWSLWRMWQA